MNKAKTRKTKANKIIAGMLSHEDAFRRAALCFGFVLMFCLLICPEPAFADDASDFALGDVLAMLQTLVTTIFLPLGILFSAWRIIYLAIFPGIAGVDPLDMCEKGKDVWTNVKMQLKGFGYGLAWVAGIWLLFTLIIQIVSLITGTIANSGLF